ncbi:hypothetical protein LUZ63_000576 [Rhynchospora breviuscula]|uniref:Receptor-like serine/threonine-protein kinase n=1 Tax=Rhynchospora breviuscula TaxID=2022672 RepID=A0A9Q0HW83_9POAL|nr:hypothetical protein LUZ63_000576 [Rhynchospora breviuscula]
MKKWPFAHQLLLLLLTFISFLSLTLSRDTITIDSPLAYPDTIVSSGRTFTLGLFNTSKSNLWYLGIWYTQITQQTVVWVANRDNPMPDSSGVLSINTNGSILQLQTSSGKVFWSVSPSTMVTPIAQIIDTGNFVLMEEDTGNVTWQSFDYPTDTLLPGLKSGWIEGKYHSLNSWTSSNDPTSSTFQTKLVLAGWSEFFICDGSKMIYRTGPWNGIHFTGEPQMISNSQFTFVYVSNQNETYFTFYINDTSFMTRLVLNQSLLQRYVSIGSGWALYWSLPRDHCDSYAQCGPNGVCDVDSSNSPDCTCLTGFEPKSEKEWMLHDRTEGCIRRVVLNCTSDGFIAINDVKLPDSTNVTVYSAIGLSECRRRCLMNCSCTAYSNLNILNGGSGCAMWMGDLVDIRTFNGGGWTFYYRVAGSEVPATSIAIKKQNTKNPAVIVTCVALGLLILALVSYIIQWKVIKNHGTSAYSHRQRQMSQDFAQPFATAGNKVLEEGSSKTNVMSLPIFDVGVILAATKNFALSNKLGEGGFGTVYKGELGRGEKIAVKRLADFSTQGVGEFKNEVNLIAELQHVNLVRLLGCCVEGDERMLIYEYLENKSLDTIIFDKAKSSQLDWQKRFEIIKGIARGVLYLHQDSRLRIIHRDLKASNVLLDKNMNPKISDFGLARIFCGDEKKWQTSRVVGTYGYMSPEYAMDGVFSVKSDVFSFGVLVLEIISGRKSRGIFGAEPSINLLCYAWALWKNGKALDLLHTSILVNSNNNSEIMRCIHVGLLCVQDSPEDRPHMSEVILMLNSPHALLPQPKQPGSFINRVPGHMESSLSYTVHDTSITTVEPR